MSSADTIAVKLVDGTPVDFSSGSPVPVGFAGLGWDQLVSSFPFVVLESQASGVPVADLVSLTEEARQADPQADVADLSLFFAIRLADVGGLDEQLVDSLVGLLRALPFVESAERASDVDQANVARPVQFYLNDADTGLRIEALRFIAGGTGSGVRVVVVDDLDFDRNHPDLLQSDGSSRIQALTIQSSSAVNAAINHSTATLGIIAGVDNTFGIVGIATGAEVLYAGTRRPVADLPPGSGIVRGDSTDLFEAFVRAALAIRGGDVVSCSLGVRAKPMFDTGTGSGIKISGDATIPVENDFSIASLLRLMRARGIVVVLAAGNGVHKGFVNPPVDEALDLDAHPELVLRNSGAIVVGGLEPVFQLPPLTQPAALQRWSRTTFGTRVTCSSWANGVTVASDSATTVGLQISSGTSLAAPMVAGGIACLQGISRSKQGVPLTPQQVHDLLVDPIPNRDWAPSGKVGLFPQFSALAQHI